MDDTLNNSQKVQQESLQTGDTNSTRLNDFFSPANDLNAENFGKIPATNQEDPQLSISDASLAHMSAIVKETIQGHKPETEEGPVSPVQLPEPPQTKTGQPTPAENTLTPGILNNAPNNNNDKEEKIPEETEAEQLAERFEKNSDTKPETFIEELNLIKDKVKKEKGKA